MREASELRVGSTVMPIMQIVVVVTGAILILSGLGITLGEQYFGLLPQCPLTVSVPPDQAAPFTPGGCQYIFEVPFSSAEIRTNRIGFPIMLLGSFIMIVGYMASLPWRRGQ